MIPKKYLAFRTKRARCTKPYTACTTYLVPGTPCTKYLVFGTHRTTYLVPALIHVVLSCTFCMYPRCRAIRTLNPCSTVHSLVGWLVEWPEGRVVVVAMDIAASGPALPAEPRPVHESAPLPSDYPAWGGVPQCLAAATEPVQIVPSVWEVQAGLPMEAFWCTSGPPEVTQYNFTPAVRGKGKAKTRKKARPEPRSSHPRACEELRSSSQPAN